MDPSQSIEIQVQALNACAPYYAPKISSILQNPLPMTIPLPPLDTVEAILAAQAKVVEAMAAGRLDMTAGQSLMNSLALMIRSRELGAAAGPPVIHIENHLPDLPIAENDPAHPQTAQGLDPGQTGAEPANQVQVIEIPQRKAATTGTLALGGRAGYSADDGPGWALRPTLSALSPVPKAPASRRQS
jgi:hypothetical protein